MSQNKSNKILVLSAGLFGYVLSELKTKYHIDVIEENNFTDILKQIFGEEYVDNNWIISKITLNEINYVETGVWYYDNKLHLFIKIKDHCMKHLEGWIPNEYWRQSIEKFLNDFKPEEL